MSELKRLEQLFQEAADLEPEARRAFLDREAEDSALRRRLEAMLDDLDSGDTLQQPTPPFDSLGPGASIGRYRLLEPLGEGGFGRVYRAEQQEPVRRQVALKVVKAGMDSREVVARFEAERQALALMDHPSIAKVLDGGITDAEGAHGGRPYFVMELVRGLPITEYCRREGLGIGARLELFLDVCAAVQHAHQKGVIHRDLKPSNVLVTIQDGRAVPKVIDFGVAKAMHGRLTDKTLFTSFHHFIGTPAYMSPEQAEMSVLDIDTRADVYSLGVLLYELLTGSTPFHADTLARAGLAEIQRILREDRPPRPSTRAREAGEAGKRVDVDLARRLRGDLDWIVMKALEKERGRRYGTASELADDLRRHLAREPVLAGPPSRSYRLGKFLSRHRATVVSALLLVLALAGGVVGTSIGLYEASQQRDAAQREAERARAVTDFLIGTLSLADIEEALDPELSVRRLLDRAAAQAENVLGDQPVAEARVRSTLGRAYESLDEHPLAEHQLRRALELSDQVCAESHRDSGAAAEHGTGPHPESHRGGALEGLELYDTLWSLTHVLFKVERPDAQAIAQRARVVAHALVRERDPELADLLDRFIEIIRSGIHTPDPEPVLEAVEVLDRAMALAEDRIPSGDPLWPVLADSCMDGSYTLWYTPHEAMAESMLEHVIAIRRRELPQNHADTGEAVGVLAGVLARNGRADEAESRLREAVEELEAVFPEDGFQVAFAHSMLGENLAAQGRFEEAEPLLLASHDVLLEVSDDPATFFPIDSYSRVIRLYDTWGRQDQAHPFRMALAELLATAHWPLAWTFSQVILGPEQEPLIRRIERFDQQLGGYSYSVDPGDVEADELLPEVDPLIEAVSAHLPAGDPRTRAIGRSFLVWTHALGPGELRRRLIVASLDILGPWAPTVPLDAAEAHAALSLEDRGSLGPERDVDALLDRSLELMALFDESASWYTANLEARIARALLEHGRTEEAEAILEDSLEVLGVQLGPTNRDYQAVERLLERARSGPRDQPENHPEIQ